MLSPRVTFTPECPLIHTRLRLERELARTFLRRSAPAAHLRDAVVASARELRDQGIDNLTAAGMLGSLVEDAGRTSGADRLDVFTGKPSWTPVRASVMDWTRDELTVVVPAL